MALLVLPIGTLMYLFSDLVTLLLLGNKWKDASTIIGLWGLTSSIMVVFSYLSSEVYRASGKPRLSFWAQVLHLIFLIPVCIFSLQRGFSYFVLFRSIIRLQSVVVHVFMISTFFTISFRSMLKNIAPGFIGSIFMGLVGLILVNRSQSVVAQILSIGGCILLYILAIKIFIVFSKKVRLKM